MAKFRPYAEGLGGKKTWRFNQGKFSQWKKRIGTGTLMGICWACSVAYIVGEHLKQPLKEKVGDNGDLHGGAYRKLIRVQNSCNSLQEQEKAEKGLFSKNGLALDTFDVKSGARANGDDALGGEIAEKISKLESCYIMISIRWKNSGHAMAAALSPGNYRFFDPNAGEYSFSDMTAFKRFVSYFISQKYESIKAYSFNKVS